MYIVLNTLKIINFIYLYWNKKKELQQLFIDMQVLVKNQGEVINQIEIQVNSANDNTEKGVEELKEAVVYQVTIVIIKFQNYKIYMIIKIFHLTLNLLNLLNKITYILIIYRKKPEK